MNFGSRIVGDTCIMLYLLGNRVPHKLLSGQISSMGMMKCGLLNAIDMLSIFKKGVLTQGVLVLQININSYTFMICHGRKLPIARIYNCKSRACKGVPFADLFFAFFFFKYNRIVIKKTAVLNQVIFFLFWKGLLCFCF